MESLEPATEAIYAEAYLSLGLSSQSKEVSEFPRVLSLLSSFLERAVQKSEKLLDLKELEESDTVFHGLRAPNLSIQRYLERIFKYSRCSPSCFVLALVYMDRYLHRSDIYMTSLNVHRLLITSVVVAAKFNDDAFFNNAYYAKVGGVSTTEMNRLELNFLFSLDFRLRVSIGTFGSSCMRLESEAAAYQVERPIQECGLTDQGDTSDSSASWRSRGTIMRLLTVEGTFGLFTTNCETN